MLEGKKALVTGISGGIGIAVAERLIQEGAEVLGSYRSMKPELEALKEGVKLFQLDTDARSEIADTLRQEIRAFGGIDILINCIGITNSEPLYAANADKWEKVVETNLFSAMRIMQAAIVPIISKKNGAIINISSIFGSVGGIGQSSYCASKAALDGMTRAVALELAAKKIRVNTVAPGFIETDMTSGFSEEFRKESIDSVPMKRFGKPEEVAALCAFLASDDARYITGQTFMIDGGLSAR